MRDKIKLDGKLQSTVAKLEAMAEDRDGYVVLDQFKPQTITDQGDREQGVIMRSRLPLSVELLGEAALIKDLDNAEHTPIEHGKANRTIQLSNVIETIENDIAQLYGAAIILIDKEDGQYYLDDMHFELDAFDSNDPELYVKRAINWLEALDKRYAAI